MFRKPLFVLAVMLCLILSCTGVASAHANEIASQNSAENVIVPYWSYVSSVKTLLSISSTGTATCSGTITGYQGTTTKVSIALYLQQYKNGNWTNVRNWSDSFNSYRGNLTGTASVSKGYPYRLKASYTASAGSASENIVDYSQVVTY
jgi:hypothetical protein